MKHLLFILSLSAFCVAAEEPQQMVEALRVEVRLEAKALSPGDTHRAALLHSLGRVLAPETDLVTDRPGNDLSSAVRWLQFVSNSPKVQKLCEALLAETHQRAAQRAHEYSEKVTTELQDALHKGLAATSAGEIDAPLAQVVRLRRGSYSEQEFDLRPATSLVYAAESMLLDCQDLLMAREGAGLRPRRDGRDETVRVRQLAGYDSLRFAALIPRSEMLERIQTLLERIPKTATRLTEGELNEQVQTIIAGLHKPEEMTEADQKITALLDGQRALGNPHENLESANRFRKWYASYQAVLKGTPLDRFRYSDIGIGGTHTPIENALRPLVLARVLDLPKDLAQKEGESVDDFLLRVFKSACSASDWAMAGRISEFAGWANLRAVINRDDETGINRLRSASTEEAAGAYAPAVIGYLDALASGSQLIPLDHIGRRLQDLRQKHPEDYAAALDSFHNRPQKTFRKPNQPSPGKP